MSSEPTLDPRWLLVTTTSAGVPSSTLRVHVWRRLRAAGALYLHQGVAVLPDVPKTRRNIDGLQRRATQDGASLRVIPITIHGPELDAVIGAFCDERNDEYREVQSEAAAFLAELADERAKGRTTYTEFEESEAGLRRLDTWFGNIRARDYFDATSAQDAAAAVEDCRRALALFERDAFAAEAGEAPGRDVKASRTQRHGLGVVEDAS